MSMLGLKRGLEYSLSLQNSEEICYTHITFIASWTDARFYRSLPLKTIPSSKNQNQNNGLIYK